MGKIFYIIGKSASGKDKIYGTLIKNKELNLQRLILYTTRPIRAGEHNGVEYYFVSEEEKKQLENKQKIIECRSYQTIHGIWSYFTVDDGQVNLKQGNYIGIGTLESYNRIRKYYGEENVCPIYIEVEDGERLSRALNREKEQKNPKYEEMCRRFLADCIDFSEENIRKEKIVKRFKNENFYECIQNIEYYVKSQI